MYRIKLINIYPNIYDKMNITDYKIEHKKFLKADR
jgi:hypothetical protein